MSNLMKAYVIEAPGGPEALELREVPRPEERPGWVLIRVKAFGLNRSEWFTRIGDSPSVRFPRVLGIECVGEVVAAPGGDLGEGQTVMAMMGGMGRVFDGSYAEYTLVPRRQVFAIETDLGWEQLGALPEMLQTTHGSLYTGLEIEGAKTLLIRGGTSSVGLAALALAKAKGLTVFCSSRSGGKAALLKERGADHVLIDEGVLAQKASEAIPGGVDRVLELIGTTTLLDSLQCVRRGGIVCMTGILGGQWAIEEFRPMEHIPTGVKLTTYSGEASDIAQEQMQEYVSQIERGSLVLPPGPTFRFSELQEAHRVMDANSANGKIVVLVE